MFDQKQKNDGVSDIKDLQRLFAELFGPLLPINTQDFITKPSDFDTYLKKALTFLESISTYIKSYGKNDDIKKLIQQIFQCWMPNLGTLFAKAINDNQQAFIQLITFIDVLNKFINNFVESIPKDYLKFLDFNRSLFNAFVELQKAFDTPYLDQANLALDYLTSVKGFISSLSKVLETATINPLTSDQTQDITFKTIVIRCLNDNHEKIKAILMRCIKRDLSKEIILLLDKCLGFLQKSKKCFSSSQKLIAKASIKKLMLHYQLLKIQALTNNPKYSEELIQLAWQVLAIINQDNHDQSSQEVINKNKLIIQGEILMHLYTAFIYTSLAKDNWKNAEFYLNKASEEEKKTVRRVDPDERLSMTCPTLISAMEKMIDYFIGKKYYKLAIEYQQRLKVQYQRKKENTDKQNKMCIVRRNNLSLSTSVPQNSVISLTPKYFEEKAKKITNKLAKLEDSIKANEQKHYQQIKEILCTCDDRLGFTLKTNDISTLLTLSFDDKRKQSFFSYKLNLYKICCSSKKNYIELNSNNIQTDTLNKAIKLALQSLPSPEIQHTEIPAPKISPGKEEDDRPSSTDNYSFPADDFHYSTKETSSSSLKKKKKKNRESSTSSNTPVTILQPQKPILTVTWQGKTIIPKDVSSDYLAVFLETSYFPDHSYIGLLDKKLSDKIPPDQWKTFVSRARPNSPYF